MAGIIIIFYFGKILYITTGLEFWEDRDRYRGMCTGFLSHLFLYFLFLFLFFSPSFPGSLLMQRGPIPFCPSRLVHVLLPFQINGVAIIVMAKKPFKNFVNIRFLVYTVVRVLKQSIICRCPVRLWNYCNL